jgi:hypothetical protein
MGQFARQLQVFIVLFFEKNAGAVPAAINTQ